MALGVWLLRAGSAASDQRLRRRFVRPPPPPIQKIPATPGTYAVVVTASADGTIHNVKLTVVVQ